MSKNKLSINEIVDIVSDFCSFILDNNYSFSDEEIHKYVCSLNKNEIDILCSIDENILFKEQDGRISKLIDKILFKSIKEYVEKFAENKAEVDLPFYFVGDEFYNFKHRFYRCFINESKKCEFPFVFSYIFDYIDKTAEHYQLFESFYKVETDEKHKQLLKDVEKNVEDTTKKQINKTINKKLNSALKEFNEHVEEETQRISRKVSESSVTILGIFSGIIVTFVAGLSYTASVLESISSANFFKLLSVASIIGLICYHLISLMFHFIVRIKEGNNQSFKWNVRDTVVTVILVICMLFFGACQYCPWLNKYVEDAKSPTSTQVQIDVNQQDNNNQVDVPFEEPDDINSETNGNVENTLSTNSATSDTTK